MRSSRVLLLVGFLAAAVLPGMRPAAAWTLDDPARIVAEGASFSEPAKWTRLEPRQHKTKGWFVSPDSTPMAPVAMIVVDVGRPTAADFRAAAESTARKWGGKVLEEKTTLDGVEAFRVRVAEPGEGLQPVEAVVAMKDGKLYLLMGGATPGRSVVDQVEEVRKSWRWEKPPAP